MKRLFFASLMVLTITATVKSQVVYKLNYLEMYQDDKVVSTSKLDVSQEKLIIDEDNNKITIVPIAGYKTQIFKILKKTKTDDTVKYYCEFKNPNGTANINLELDVFYRYLKCIGVGESGNYLKYYFE